MSTRTPINLLADILKKAQGRIDQETGEPIHVGREVAELRMHYDNTKPPADLVERVRSAIRLYNMLPNNSHERGRDFAPPAYDVLTDVLAYLEG